MIQKAPSRNRFLKIVLGITLGVAVALTLLLLFVPEKEGFRFELPGVLLYDDGEAAPCTVSLGGTIKTYAFDKDAPICTGTLYLDGQEVGEVSLTFEGEYAIPGETGVKAVMTKDQAIAAQITRDGKTCLLLAPAPDAETAQTLLARFLAESVFVRQQGWEAFQH